MFPALKFKVTGLDIDAMYVFVLDIIPVDSFRCIAVDTRLNILCMQTLNLAFRTRF